MTSTTTDNDQTTNNNNNNNKKLGKSCCLGSCDMKRGVIITSIIGILLSVVSYVTNLVLVFNNIKDPALLYSSELIAQIDLVNNIQIIMTVLIVCSYAISIVGAIKYNIKYIVCNSIFIIIYFTVLALLFINQKARNGVTEFSYATLIIPFVMCVMTVYTNKGLCQEIKSGIMTNETYETREKQSCCCV